MNTKTHSLPIGPRPPEAWEPLMRVAKVAGRPLERFLGVEAASGILLLIATTIAMLWANSPWSESYFALWHTQLGIRLGNFVFERSLEWVVNDCLMVVFFFVVGLEIRREIHHGELSELRRAALPAAAAVGGMLVPAAIYLLIAGAKETHSGWGVPMATDIAFAVGILTLLGKRVPAALRVLLLALAVIDDLGAIIVIALFYSSGVSVSGLLVGLLGVFLIFVMQWLGVRKKLLYVVPTTVTWAGIYAAGVHPTIAGVVVGIITPVTAWLGTRGFLEGVKTEIDHLSTHRLDMLSTHQLSESLRRVNMVRREALSPSESLIETLHPWVAYGIMPIFALANAGVVLSGGISSDQAWHVSIGTALGLLLGKPLGICLVSLLVLKLGWAVAPRGITTRHLVVLGVVAGVGFTMALFIAQLAFNDPGLLSAAKLGVLSASLLAGVIGLVLGRFALKAEAMPGIAQTADEAERSTEL